jgi:hypothetical protein
MLKLNLRMVASLPQQEISLPLISRTTIGENEIEMGIGIP